MNILSLDIGEHTGFATLISGKIESGSEHLKLKGSESAGFKYMRFTDLLRRLHSLGNFDLIVYEKPHGLQGHAIESMNGYVTRIHEFVAHEFMTTGKEIEYRGESPATIKKSVTGNGRAGKEDMMNWFIEYFGEEPIDDNEADAMALLVYTMRNLGI